MTDWTDRWTGKTLWMALEEAAVQRGDRDAYLFPNGRLSLPELRRRADEVSRGFLALGVGHGDCVAIWMAGYAEWAALYFGLARIGAVMVPLNTRYKPHEIEYVMGKSRASVLAFKDERAGGKDYADILLEACPELPGSSPGRLHCAAMPDLRTVIAIDGRPISGTLAFPSLVEAGQSISEAQVVEAERQVKPDDTAMIQFTSGTTAFPKGAELFQIGMLRGAQVNADFARLCETDRFFSPQPFYHCGGSIFVMLSPIISGCFTVVQPYFDATEALRLMDEERCNVTMGHQPHWIEYLNHPDRPKRKLELDRALVFASPEVNRLVQGEMGIAGLMAPYGLTETHLAGTFCDLDEPLEVRLSTVGRPPPGMDMEIRNAATNQPVPDGEAGEICFRGWGVMKGYYDDPERTAEALDADGWFHTGDLGAIGDDGNLRIRGRIKEMIRVGGENVAAAEVEGYLLHHPAVKQVVAVGKADPRLAEVVMVYVELKEGASAGESELIDFCRSGLASFKVPREVRFVSDWPMSGTGKIQRFLLKEEANAIR
ncbi:MAG: AMP-binding protein [Chloroflexota bacterium]